MTPNETFKNLNRGRTDAYVLLNGDKYTTIQGNLTDDHYKQHLEGKISLGVIPITPDGNCRFGIIDDDSHKADKSKPIQKYNYNNLLKKLKILGIVATVFKSKNGGAHIKLNFDKPYPAKKVRRFLKKIAYQICESSYDLLPKQDELKKEETGTCINLPYHNGNTRVVLDNEGNELDIQKGMEYESNRLLKLEQLNPYYLFSLKDYPDGRNNKLFQAGVYLKKNFSENWKDKLKELNNAYSNPLPINEIEKTIITSVESKDYCFDPESEEIPKELVAHDVMVYRDLPLQQPKWILERLIKEKTINFISAQKGTGKSELAIGLMWSISKGLPFLNYKTNGGYCYPCTWIDGEMDPYDSIDRTTPYLETFGHPPKDYFQIINFALQKNQNIPDIKDEVGQNLILQHLKKQEEQTGKKPLVCLDNLRSLSNYKENDSDGFRPIGLFLRNLRGLGYTVLVIDHSGKDANAGLRGTSSKTDWANVVLLLKPEGPKGQKFMKIKVIFDKARGLRPDETADFVCQYDFKGNWKLGTSDKELGEEIFIDRIKGVLKKAPEMKQEDIGKIVGCSTGKVNKLIKKIRSS
jgi:hypothetical protein